jgi:hypothetical protein
MMSSTPRSKASSVARMSAAPGEREDGDRTARPVTRDPPAVDVHVGDDRVRPPLREQRRGAVGVGDGARHVRALVQGQLDHPGDDRLALDHQHPQRARGGQARPPLSVRIGSDWYVPQQRILPSDEAAAVLRGWTRRQRWFARLMLPQVGLSLELAETERTALVNRLPFVAFSPSGGRSPRVTRAHQIEPAG